MIGRVIASWLTNHVMPILPWVWLIVALVATAWFIFTNPVLARKYWRTILVLILVPFGALWVWQHFAVFGDLRRENAELHTEITQTRQEVTNLNGSITNYTDGVARIEEGQRRIATDIRRARVGLNSSTAIREAQNDPVQASSNLSDRYNRLGGMFDDATSGGTGTANVTAAPTGTDPDAAGGVAGDPTGSSR